MVKDKKKMLIILGILIVLCAAYFVNETLKAHKDGNILNLPAQTLIEDEYMPIPWNYNSFLTGLMYKTLFLPDYTLHNYTQNLASYSIEDDGFTYFIDFFEGSRWSDGEPITIDDVLWSIETLPKVEKANNIYKSAFEKIKSLEVNGNRLTIKMNERTTMLLPMLAQLAILPKHKLEQYEPATLHLEAEYWVNPVVSGMYRVGKMIPNNYVSLVRNEKYDGKIPQIDEIRLHTAKTSTAKLDYFTTNNIAEMINFRAMRGYTEYGVDMLFYRYLVFNVEGDDGKVNEVMQDVRIRQAIAMSIDRQRLLYNVYLNMGNVVNGAGTKDAMGPYNYNPKRAKELIAESGYDLDRPLRFAYYYGDPTSLTLIEEMKKYLEAVGFKVELLQASAPASVFLFEKRDYDFHLKGLASFQVSEWFGEYASTHIFMPKVTGGKGELDELVLALSAETDDRKHAALLQQLVQKEEELLYKFPLLTLSQAVYINTDRVNVPKNFKHGNSYYLFDMHLADWSIKKE